MEESRTVEVVDDVHHSRYAVTVDGITAGFAVYRLRGGRYVFVHTEIDDAYSGRGLGSILARGALDDVEAKGARVVPLCPFIAGWLDRHPDYQDLIDQEVVRAVGPPD